MNVTRRYCVLGILSLLSAGTASLFSYEYDDRTISFDGPAGQNQTSPTSPARGKISATGSYSGNFIDRIELWTRVQGTTEWTVTACTKDDLTKTWSGSIAGLGAGTYEVKAVAFFTGPVTRAETDVRTVAVAG